MRVFWGGRKRKRGENEVYRQKETTALDSGGCRLFGARETYLSQREHQLSFGRVRGVGKGNVAKL